MIETDQLYDVSSSGGGAQHPQMALKKDLVNETHGDFEFGANLDGPGKLDLALLVCAKVAAGITFYDAPNHDHHNHHGP